MKRIYTQGTELYYSKKKCRFEAMKRFLTVAFMALVIPVFGQTGFRIGPTASYLASKPYVKDSLPGSFNFRYKSGFNLGLTAFYGFTQKTGISAGIQISSKGYRIFNDSNRNGDVLKHNQTFLEIPIGFTYKQRLNSVSFVRENIGLTLCSQISSSVKEKSNSSGNFRITERMQNNFYPMLNLGIDIGNQAKNGNVFVFSVMFRQGFANNNDIEIYNSKTATKPYFSLGHKGSYIGISISYLFNLKNFKNETEYYY